METQSNLEKGEGLLTLPQLCEQRSFHMHPLETPCPTRLYVLEHIRWYCPNYPLKERNATRSEGGTQHAQRKERHAQKEERDTIRDDRRGHHRCRSDLQKMKGRSVRIDLVLKYLDALKEGGGFIQQISLVFPLPRPPRTDWDKSRPHQTFHYTT